MSLIWKSVNAIAVLASRLFRHAEKQCVREAMRSCGSNFRLERGGRFIHPEFVSVGNEVSINSHAWISATPVDGGDVPVLEIGSGTYIGRFVSIACTNRILLGENVLISDRVFITDALHGFQDVSQPISRQPVYSPGPVEIGDGTWIGIGACILPNVRIGKNCVIGANAVVTNDVPDYHVALGVPARVVRRVDDNT